MQPRYRPRTEVEEARQLTTTITTAVVSATHPDCQGGLRRVNSATSVTAVAASVTAVAASLIAVAASVTAAGVAHTMPVAARVQRANTKIRPETRAHLVPWVRIKVQTTTRSRAASRAVPASISLRRGRRSASTVPSMAACHSGVRGQLVQQHAAPARTSDFALALR